MAFEIERKFLVSDNTFVSLASSRHHIIQAYLSTEPARTVRIRICDDKAWITVKGKNQGATRHEWEYEIPVADASEMIDLCTTGVLAKWRYIVPFAGYKWEVDVYENKLAPLIVAEVELENADADVVLPPFVSKEVTGDKRYYNSALAERL